MSLIKTITANIKDRRNELMLSQQDVADESGMKRQVYGKAESGDSDIRVSTLERIAKALDVEPIELLKERN